MKYLYLSIILLSLSCDKEAETERFEYIIFGHFYGECLGENCVATYKLTANKIFVDTKDSYRGSEGFEFEELSEVEFELSNHLFNDFPDELLDEKEGTIGCPDCVDQGGILLIVKNGDEKSWFIDQSLQNVPKYLHEYITEVNSVLEKLLN